LVLKLEPSTIEVSTKCFKCFFLPTFTIDLTGYSWNLLISITWSALHYHLKYKICKVGRYVQPSKLPFC